MSRGSTLVLLGIFTIVMPYSGLPASVRTFLMFIIGGCVLSIGMSIRTRDARTAHTPPAPLPPQAPEAPSEISPI